MPVTSQVTAVHTLTKINVDVEMGTVWCHFKRADNGIPAGTVEHTFTGQDVLDLLATTAVADQALGNEITDAVYRLAIARGVISGDIS